jgi:hypothetical protein
MCFGFTTEYAFQNDVDLVIWRRMRLSSARDVDASLHSLVESRRDRYLTWNFCAAETYVYLWRSRACCEAANRIMIGPACLG